jgi:hypothetical protein
MMLDVQIDHIHCGAVCKEIGEVLSIKLGPQSIELPPRLLDLMQQLAKAESRQVMRDWRAFHVDRLVYRGADLPVH